MTRKVNSAVLALLCVSALAPASALAHGGGAHAGAFSGGFAHPFGGLDHILLVFAAGVWAVRSPSRPAFAGAFMAAVIFSVFHCFAYGAGSGLSYIGGVVLATALLNAGGAGAGLALKRFDRFPLARHAGPVLAVIGVFLFFV